jgi:phage N-6-adenine-methyltransferase
MNRALLSSKATTYGTPVSLYSWLDRQFRFTVDVAALPSNAKCARFWSPKENGLAQSWEGETAWMNPPFGRDIGSWLEKARDEAVHERALVVQLLPARVDTSWWRTFVMNGSGDAGRLLRSAYQPDNRVLWLRWEGLVTGVHFTAERIVFEGESNGAPFPTAIVVHAHPSRKPPPHELEAGEELLTLGWPR